MHRQGDLSKRSNITRMTSNCTGGGLCGTANGGTKRFSIHTMSSWLTTWSRQSYAENHH